jgi:Amt family ammonium transporter
LFPDAFLAATPAFAADTPTLNSGDTAWMLDLGGAGPDDDHPGLGLFYCGMVRRKNVLATLAQSFGATALITVLWMVVGYSLAFKTNPDAGLNRFIGDFSYLFLGPMKVDSLSGTIPGIGLSCSSR